MKNNTHKTNTLGYRTKKLEMPAPVTIIKNPDNTLRLDADYLSQAGLLSVSIDTGVVQIFQKNGDEWEELHQTVGAGGYMVVRIRQVPNRRLHYRCYVHRLVAAAYCENPNGNKYVDHIDGDRQNNNPKNLRWVTLRENQLYRRLSEQKKLKEHNRGHNRDSLKRGRYLKLSRADYAEPLYFETITDAARAIGCTSQNISMCLRRGYRPVGWTAEYANIED